MNHSNQNNKVRKVSSRPVNINRAPPVVASVAAMTTAAVVSKKKVCALLVILLSFNAIFADRPNSN